VNLFSLLVYIEHNVDESPKDVSNASFLVLFLYYACHGVHVNIEITLIFFQS